MKKSKKSLFENELKRRVKEHHANCLRDGTVGLGFNSLFAAVSGRGIHGFSGAPLGTNAAYYFKQTLRELITELKLDSFIIQ